MPDFFPIQKELAKNKILIPTKPNEVYSDYWNGWDDFIGKNKEN